MANQNTETKVDKQARIFALVHYQKHSHEGLIEMMDKVAASRKWRGFVAKRFRMAVMVAMGNIRAAQARR